MKHVFKVTGMTCQHCENAVYKALKRVDEQAQIKVDRQAQRVEVDSAQDAQRFSQAIQEEGYTVEA